MIDHDLDEKGVCTKCNRKPGSSRRRCPGVHWYVYGTAPDHLSTFSQLRRAKLKPKDRKQPQGCIVTAHHEIVYLYDDNEAIPRRQETERQREARLVAWSRIQQKYTCKRCGYVPESLAAIQYEIDRRKGLCQDCKEVLEMQEQEDKLQAMLERDRLSACEWAYNLLHNRTDWAIIDTETTALRGRVCEIGIVSPSGTTLFHSLVNPECPVEARARAKHGITDEELAASPTLPQIWQQLQDVLKDCTTLIAWNADFDRARLKQSASYYKLPILPQSWSCAMMTYSAYHGNWSERHASYTFVGLGSNHRAVGDALAALEKMREMAKGYSS